MTVKVELFVPSQTSDDVFILDDATKGKLDDTTYVLGGGPGAFGAAVDITDQFSSVRTERGRPHELDDMQTGTASGMLRNYDRDFDPEWRMRGPAVAPTGTYGPIRPGKRLRISDEATVVFDGVVEDYDHVWSADKSVEASLVAADALGQIARKTFREWVTVDGQLPGERIAAVLDRPEVAVPTGNRDLDDGVFPLQSDFVSHGSDVTNYLHLVARSDVGRLFASRTNTVTFRDRHTSITAAVAAEFGDVGYMDNTAGEAQTSDSVQVQPTTDFALVLHFTPGTISGTKYAMAKWTTSGGRTFWLGRVGGSGNIMRLSVSSDGINGQFTSDGPAIADDTETWYGVTFDSDNGSVAEIRHFTSTDGINWALTDTDLHTGTLVPHDGSAPIEIGRRWNSNIQPGDYYTARLYHGIGDNATPDAGTLVAEFDGSLFDDGATSGSATDPQGNVWTLAGVVAIVHTGIPFRVIGVRAGTEQLYTRVSVDRENGIAQTALSDQSTIDEFDVRSLEIPGLLLSDDLQSKATALALVDRFDDPAATIESLTVILDTLSAADRTKVVGLEIGDKVTVDWTPTGTGLPVRQLDIIDGISYESAVDGLTTVTLSLSDATNVFGFVLDDAAVGVLDTSVLAF